MEEELKEQEVHSAGAHTAATVELLLSVEVIFLRVQCNSWIIQINRTGLNAVIELAQTIRPVRCVLLQEHRCIL